MAARGFTLIELLVVLAIMALLAAMAAPRLARSGGAASVAAASREIRAGLAEARSIAIAKGRPEPFVVDMAHASYRVGARSAALPPGVAVELLSLAHERGDDPVGDIRFFPDGSASGGFVALIGATLRRELRIDWLTGRVFEEAPR